MTEQTRTLLLQLVDQATVSPAHPQAVELLAALVAARVELLTPMVEQSQQSVMVEPVSE